MIHSTHRRVRIIAAVALAASALGEPAIADGPEGTIAALLLQVNHGYYNSDTDTWENPGSVSGEGFGCNARNSEAAFDGDFPQAGPCLRFFSDEQSITVTALPRAHYVFGGWRGSCIGWASGYSDPVLTISTAQVPYTPGSGGHVFNCMAEFWLSECFVPPDGGGGEEDLVAGETAAQVEECPADDPDVAESARQDRRTRTPTNPRAMRPDVICGSNDTINGPAATT
jgi:hypothetical protein